MGWGQQQPYQGLAVRAATTAVSPETRNAQRLIASEFPPASAITGWLAGPMCCCTKASIKRSWAHPDGVTLLLLLPTQCPSQWPTSLAGLPGHDNPAELAATCFNVNVQAVETQSTHSWRHSQVLLCCSQPTLPSRVIPLSSSFSLALSRSTSCTATTRSAATARSRL